MFAVIGDYGDGDQDEADVAALVNGWEPDFIITLGDNNYPWGQASTIDANIGQFFQQYIYPYTGAYGPGATENRFFPTLGNHDWLSAGGQAYFDYFQLPGNGRYYEFTWGPVDFFAIDSDLNEPDGVTFDSVQGQWLQAALQASTSCFKVVYMHHYPHSSGDPHPADRYGYTDLQWPYADWGADVVLAGHDHTYERLLVDGFPYFVNGVGGRHLHPFTDPLHPDSQFRYNDDFGAQRVTVASSAMTFEFFNRQNMLIDTYVINKSCP